MSKRRHQASPTSCTKNSLRKKEVFKMGTSTSKTETTPQVPENRPLKNSKISNTPSSSSRPKRQNGAVGASVKEEKKGVVKTEDGEGMEKRRRGRRRKDETTALMTTVKRTTRTAKQTTRKLGGDKKPKVEDTRLETPTPPISPALKTPTRSPLAKAIQRKQLYEAEAGKMQTEKVGRRRIYESARCPPRVYLSEPKKTMSRLRVNYKQLNIDTTPMPSLSSVKRLYQTNELLPAVRNQSDFFTCVVCKDTTLLRAPESTKRIRDGKCEPPSDTNAMTLEEDPALRCTSCNNHFHVVCVFGEVDLQDWALRNPAKFVCQECVRCRKCNTSIYDPGNVQCVKCGSAYHESCKPPTKTTTPCQVYNPALPYTCPQCDSQKKKLIYERASLKRKTNQTLLFEPEAKQVKLGKTGNAKDDKAAKKIPKPRLNKMPRVETDEEFEAQRQQFLTDLAKKVRPDPGVVNSIGAQESTFSHLTEEFLDEEEKHRNSDDDDMDYVPFSRVARDMKGVEGSNQEDEVKVPVFFYGNIAYQPRFYDFLNTILPAVQRVAFCHRCLIHLSSATQLVEHTTVCQVSHPPGTQIYQQDNLSVWEISGESEKVYCRRLSLFAKTFIGSKAVHFEVEGFKFYVLVEHTTNDFRLAGYFSKEIQPIANNNLSCLLVLPWSQRKQYGLFLIDLSYQLSICERKIGSPEHPLSDAGLKTYRQYWYSTIMSFLRAKLYDSEAISLREIREHTGIDERDILETMIIADMTFIVNEKLQINIETPFYATLASLRRRYVSTKLLKVKKLTNLPFTTYA